MIRIICFFSILILSSCTQIVEKPDNLVSEDKMIDVLTDIYTHQQSSYMNEMGGKPLDYASVNANLLKEHGVTVKDFEKSYEYYVLNPDIYEPMLLEIRNNIESQLPEQERIKRENQRKDAEKAVKK